MNEPSSAPSLIEARSHDADAFREHLLPSDDVPIVASPAAKPPKRRVRRVLGGLLALMVLLAIGAAIGVAWLGTDDGHQFIARQLESIISGQIRGHLTVGTLDEVDLHHVVGRDIVFADESGRPVIEAELVDMQYELSELLGGHFVSHAAHATGGRVIMETNGSGELLVNRAFRSAHPGPPGQPVGADVVHLENLEAEDVTVIMHLGSAPVATLRHVGAILLVRAPENGAAIVHADHTHGALHVAAPIPFDLRVAGANLDVDGAAQRRIHLSLPSHMGDHRIDVVVTATALPDDTLSVDARIRPHGLGAMLAAAGMIGQATLAETQSPLLDVTVEMQ